MRVRSGPVTHGPTLRPNYPTDFSRTSSDSGSGLRSRVKLLCAGRSCRSCYDLRLIIGPANYQSSLRLGLLFQSCGMGEQILEAEVIADKARDRVRGA
jgi:hypothetical protein